MPTAARLGVFFAIVTGVSLVLLDPGMALPFYSDDLAYIAENRYVHGLSPENVAAILDPAGLPARYTMNYAPLHLLAHAAEWSAWGPNVPGYHIVNLLVHVLAVTLFVQLLVVRSLPFLAAALAGAVFAFHPANVETVVWIFQLKTLLALALAIGALLAHPRLPWLGVLLFGLALLSKIAALFALPVALIWSWPPGDAQPEWQRRRRWLLGWVAVALLCAVPQFTMFERGGEVHQPLAGDAFVGVRSIVAIGCRYVVMAFAGIGTSPFHEPDPTTSWLDPWWLAGIALGGFFAWRSIASLVQRREEAAWWVWAAAAYLPISQIFRFKYPIADRYLYFILPGLIGAVVFALRDVWPSWEGALRARGISLPAREVVTRTVAVAACALAVWFGTLTAAQARVWRSPSTISLATARNYPGGITAHRMRAYMAASMGDATRAARELRGALERGFDAFMDIQTNPTFAPLRGHPEYDIVMRDMAGDWIVTISARSAPTHRELYWLAEAHLLREELTEAEAAFVRSLELGGGFDATIREKLAALRRYLSQRAEHEQANPDGR
jgi:hypothetical protein